MDEKKLQTLQDEIKLMKGELKQSLVSVRDYLLNMELPSSEFSTILAALGGEGEQRMTMQGSLSTPEPSSPQNDLAEMEEEESMGDTEEESPEDEEMAPGEDEEELIPENEAFDDEEPAPQAEGGGLEQTLEDELPMDDLEEDEEEAGEAGEKNAEDGETEDILEEPIEEQREEQQPQLEMEEKPMDYEKSHDVDAYAGIPKVNMLANLLTWAARARKDIGPEQIPVFLEVYGLSGYLSPELKDVIIHLAEMTEEHNEPASYAEIWGNAMLSLHGILTGGEVPRHPLMPSHNENKGEAELAEEEIIEVDKTAEKPLTLKIVLPDGNGKDKEFCFDLAPGTGSKTANGSRSA